MVRHVFFSMEAIFDPTAPLRTEIEQLYRLNQEDTAFIDAINSRFGPKPVYGDARLRWEQRTKNSRRADALAKREPEIRRREKRIAQRSILIRQLERKIRRMEGRN